MNLTLAEVIAEPARCCAVLEAELFGVTVDRTTPAHGGMVYDFTLMPLPELADAGYLPERARASVRLDGTLLAFPLGRPRSWLHRNTSPLGARFGKMAGDLCLYYPQDPRALRWEWSDGFGAYVAMVHRHMFYEEYYRREDRWPVEDAPHGTPQEGAHPIRSAMMRREVRQWAS